jgi:outer membrane protein assembly factor BamB
LNAAQEPAIATLKDPQTPSPSPATGPIPEAIAFERLTFHAAPKPLAKDAVVSDWPHFLGPSRNMFSPETRLLAKFPNSGPQIVWELKRGNGYASPSIQGDRLVYTHRIDDQVIVECLHPATGQRYWEYRYPSRYEDRYGYSNGPRCTPAITGKRVIVAGVEGQLLCLDLERGGILWQRDLAKEFNAAKGFFGYGATPLILDNRIIMNLGAPNGPNVAAFDLATGKLLWGNGKQWGASYATPAPVTLNGRKLVAVLAGGESKPPVGGLLLVDPENGTIHARMPWRSKKYESVNAANPVIVGPDRIMISASYQTGSIALASKATADGIALTPTWRNPELGLHWHTPIITDVAGYGFSGRNAADLACFDLNTGKIHWQETFAWLETYKYYGEERQREFDLNRGFLLAADDRFYALGEYGHLAILDLSPKSGTVLDKAWLFPAPQTWTPPVLSRGLLYVCQNSNNFTNGTPPRLVCYDLRQATP